ncbi:MAG TPA: hypothetical protein PKV97_07170 [Thauera aminoaromatica]|nr:hypothetical protein [Thauera aminoaromatica]
MSLVAPSLAFAGAIDRARGPGNTVDAVFADMGASLLVVANGLRLLRER